MKIIFVQSVTQAFINSYVPTGNRYLATVCWFALFCFLLYMVTPCFLVMY